MQTPRYLIIHAIEFTSEMHCYFSRLMVFVFSDCFAAIHGGLVPVPVRPLTF